MNTPLASFFTKIGFEVDKTSLNALEKQLNSLESKIKSLAKSFRTVNKPIVVPVKYKYESPEKPKFSFKDTPKNLTTNISQLKEQIQLERLKASAAKAQSLANKEQFKIEALKVGSELKRISSELQSKRDNSALAKSQAQVEKAKQATLKEEYKLAQKKAVTETIYAKANAATMVQKMKTNAAADMAAIKESLDAGNKLRYSNQKREDLERDLILRKRRNEENDAIAKRRLVDDQSKVTKAQSIAQSRIQVIQANTARLAQQAITKATPYAQRMEIKRSLKDPPEGGRNGFPSLSLPMVGAGAGLLAIQQATAKAYHTANFQMAQPAQFEFITGTAQEGAKQVDFLNKEVDRLSLSLTDASFQYRQLLAATYKPLGVEQSQKLFSRSQELAAMLGLTTDAQNRMFKAFGQMASKGQVMSEELDFRLAA